MRRKFKPKIPCRASNNCWMISVIIFFNINDTLNVLTCYYELHYLTLLFFCIIIFSLIQKKKPMNFNIDRSDNLSSWTSVAKIFSHGNFCVRKIFIPINRDDNHWSCVCIDTNNDEIYFYDSLYSASKFTENIIIQIENYFKRELMNHDVCFELNWRRIYLTNTIMQDNCE